MKQLDGFDPVSYTHLDVYKRQLYWKAREYRIICQNHVKRVIYPCPYEMQYEVAHIHACIAQGLLESPVMSAQRSTICCQLVDQIIHQLEKNC